MDVEFIPGIETYWIQTGFVLAVFWCAYGLLGFHPRARVWLCRAVALTVLLLPLLQFSPAPAIAHIPPLAALNEPLSRAWPGSTSSTVLPTPPFPSAATKHAAGSNTPSAGPAWTWARLLPAVWVLGTALLLIRWGVGLVIARRLAHRASPAPDWAGDFAATLVDALGLRQRVEIRVIAHAGSPLLLGPAPLILLPDDLLAPTHRTDARSALAHELGHVREKDWLWSQGLQIVTACSWPVPLAWFLRRAHDGSAEMVCDQIAAGLLGGSERYARSLARQGLSAIRASRSAAIPMIGRSGVRRRVDLLLSGVGLPALSRRSVALLSLLLVLGCSAAAGIRLARGDDHAASDGNAAWKRHNYSAAGIQRIISRLCGYFKGIDSLSYTATETTPLGGGKQMAKTTVFASSGDHYFVELDRRYETTDGQPAKPSGPADAPSSETYAFNGALFQQLEYNGPSRLWIRKGPPFWPAPPSLGWMGGNDFLLLPFDFVNKTLTTDPHQTVQLMPDQFRRPENWVLRTRRVQNGTLLGKRGLIVDVQACTSFAPDSVISVLLDPAKDYYPVAWQIPVKSASSSQILRMSYVIDQFGTMQGGGASLPYPQRATLQATLDGKLLWSRFIAVEKVSVNDISPQDPRFTIDPRLAAVVQRENGP